VPTAVPVGLVDLPHHRIWDSLIVSDAQTAGCSTLLTEEDLQHELEIDGLRIANPFRTTVGSVS
jgi:predicted nucleic acid-binding protein